MDDEAIKQFRANQSQRYREARDDAEAIMCSLGVLAHMAHCLHELSRGYTQMPWEDEEFREIHGATIPSAADALKRNRERIAEVLEDLGEWFNGKDAVSETMEAVGTPVFEVMHKRANGVTLDD